MLVCMHERSCMHNVSRFQLLVECMHVIAILEESKMVTRYYLRTLASSFHFSPNLVTSFLNVAPLTAAPATTTPHGTRARCRSTPTPETTRTRPPRAPPPEETETHHRTTPATDPPHPTVHGNSSNHSNLGESLGTNKPLAAFTTGRSTWKQHWGSPRCYKM